MSKLYGFHVHDSGRIAPVVRLIYTKDVDGGIELKNVHELAVSPQSGAATWFDAKRDSADWMAAEVSHNEDLRKRMWTYGRLMDELPQ